jgi:hypothetical protein
VATSTIPIACGFQEKWFKYYAYYLASLFTRILFSCGSFKGTENKLKISIFWDITPCSPLKVNWRFGRVFRLHLQDRRKIQARNQHKAGNKRAEYGHGIFLQKSRLTFIGQHGDISQKAELFITVDVSTSSPTEGKFAEPLTNVTIHMWVETAVLYLLIYERFN